MNAKRDFRCFMDEFKEWKTRTENAFKEYRAKKADIKHRFSEVVAAEELAKLIKSTRIEIEACDIRLKHAAHSLAASLEKHLANEMVTEGANAQLDMLRALNDFGVKLTPYELRTLANECDSYIAKRALSAIAERSGYKMNVPSLDGMAKEAARLRVRFMPPMMYCPLGYTKEAVEILPEQPWRKEDGTPYGYMNPLDDDIYLGAQRMEIEAMPKRFDEMSERWNGTFIPEVVSIDPKTATAAEIDEYAEQVVDRAKAKEHAQEALRVEPIPVERKEMPSEDVINRYT